MKTIKNKKTISLRRVSLTNIIGYSFALITCILILQGIPAPIELVMLIVLMIFLLYTLFLESSKRLEKKDELYIINENKAYSTTIKILLALLLIGGMVADSFLDLEIKIPLNFSTCYITVSTVYIISNTILLILDRKSIGPYDECEDE